MILLFFLYGGCVKQSSNEEMSIDTVSASVETYPDNVIIRDVPDEIQFDWDEALKNIYIAGKKVVFPNTVADLGDDFNLQGIPVDNNGSVTDGLLYKGKKIGHVMLFSYNGSNYNKNSPVVWISLNDSADDSLKTLQGIYKFHICDKVKKDDIIAYFGKPTQETRKTLLYSLEDDKKFIRFSLDEEGLYSIDIMVENPFMD